MRRDKSLNLLVFFGLIGLSLLCHILIFVLVELGGRFLAEREPGVIMPLELTYAPTETQRFVPDAGVPPKEEASSSPSRFTSLHRQRVQLETQAVHKDYTGETKNRPGASASKSSAKPEAARASARPELRPKFWGMVTPEDPAVGFAPGSSLQLPKVSSLSVDLPKDVQLGALTVLNTDPMRHYSFFERFNRLSYHHWVSEVNTSYQRHTRRGQLIRSGTYSTVVGVILDKEGRVVESQIHSRSGFSDFDEAFPKALKVTGQIPNPPEELVEKDGKVRVRLLVTVVIDSPYHSRN